MWLGLIQSQDFPGSSGDKASACNAEDQGSVPGSGRSPGEGNGYPLQYSGLENSMDRGAWRATVHGVAKSRTRLNNTHSYRHTHTLTHTLTHTHSHTHELTHTHSHMHIANLKTLRIP